MNAIDDSNRNENGTEKPRSRPHTPSVRRSSLLLGDLRALYHVNNQVNLVPTSRQSLMSNQWRKVFRDKVLVELDVINSRRRLDEHKCLIVATKRNKRVLAHYFSFWQSNLVRSIKSDLVVSIENNTTGYFRQRKKSVLHVWGNIALGLDSRKSILERRRGGLEQARESLTKRLAEKGESGLIITPEMIDLEIHRIVHDLLRKWMAKYSKRNHFMSWRDHLHPLYKQKLLAKGHWAKRIQKRILVSWLLHVRACIEHTDGNFKVNHKKSAAASELYHHNTTTFVIKNWMRYTKATIGSRRLRRHILSRLARTSLIHLKLVTKNQIEMKRFALSIWIDIGQTYIKNPFRCWRNIVDNNKCRDGYERRLVTTFLHSIRRRNMYRHFRLWHHQAKYARVTSLYTRNQLAHGWLENKRMLEQLSMKTKELKDNVESSDELEASIQSLVVKLKKSEDARRQAEQSLTYEKAINDCLSRINPMCAEKVRELIPLVGASK